MAHATTPCHCHTASLSICQFADLHLPTRVARESPACSSQSYLGQDFDSTPPTINPPSLHPSYPFFRGSTPFHPSPIYPTWASHLPPYERAPAPYPPRQLHLRPAGFPSQLVRPWVWSSRRLWRPTPAAATILSGFRAIALKCFGVLCPLQSPIKNSTSGAVPASIQTW